MKSISAATLRDQMNQGKEIQLLDVREPYEHAAYNIGGALLPLGGLMSGVAAIPREIPVVVYCEKGVRSAIAIQRLEGLGFENLYNLDDGMRGWKAMLIGLE